MSGEGVLEAVGSYFVDLEVNVQRAKRLEGSHCER